MCSPEGAVPKGLPKPQENTLIKQLPFYFLASSCFVEKKYFHGNVGTYKIGGAPSA